jgi:peptide/nickel transport system permease protein
MSLGERVRGQLQGLRRLPLLWVFILLVVVIIPGIFAPLLAPYDPIQDADPLGRLAPPAWHDGGSWDHILGTDRQGRDILSRMIHGARIALYVSLSSLILSALIGVTLGLVSGWYGGWVDHIIQRIVDIQASVPDILVALLLVSVFGASIRVAIAVIVFFLWNRYTRVIRAEVLKLRSADFVMRAKVSGCSNSRIILKHLFPNVLNTVIVLATLQVGFVILLESTLSFLGVGIPRPTPAWGVMVADGRDYVMVAWWVSFFPGIAIFLSVLSLNLFGDWLRDWLDPKLRQLQR